MSAIADAYTALHNAKHGIREHLPSRQELNDELEAWRRKFPGYEFDGLSLREKFEE